MASTKPMNKNNRARTTLFLLTVSLFAAHGQNATGTNSGSAFGPSAKAMLRLTSVPPAYRAEALRLILGEANEVARELRLGETLPIEQANLVSAYITPPALVQRLGAIGNITTASYTYYCSVGNKLSYIERARSDDDYRSFQAEYLWPVSKMDTNAAYRLATQFLAAASMDVKALSRDCNVHITPLTPEGPNGQHFVPVFWVYWVKPAEEGRGNTATVELFEPTKQLRQLRVENTEYILRKPLLIPNLEKLLSQTNPPSPASPEVPVSSYSR
jgi:hypothetical protein